MASEDQSKPNLSIRQTLYLQLLTSKLWRRSAYLTKSSASFANLHSRDWVTQSDTARDVLKLSVRSVPRMRDNSPSTIKSYTVFVMSVTPRWTTTLSSRTTRRSSKLKLRKSQQWTITLSTSTNRNKNSKKSLRRTKRSLRRNWMPKSSANSNLRVRCTIWLTRYQIWMLLATLCMRRCLIRRRRSSTWSLRRLVSKRTGKLSLLSCGRRSTCSSNRKLKMKNVWIN